MAVLVDLLEEVRLRIQAGITAGTIPGIKRLAIAPASETRNCNDFPIINIWLRDFAAEPTCMQRGFVDNAVIEIGLHINKLADASNKLYNKTSSTGPLYVYNALRNVLDKNTSGSPDITFGGNAWNLRTYTTAIDYQENSEQGIVSFLLSLEAKSKLYAAGSR